MADDRYRKLRRSLRERLRVDQMAAARTTLTARLRSLQQTAEDPVLKGAIEAVLQCVSNLSEAAITCAQTSIDRSVLIEQQIDRRDFAGALHERYHDASRRLGSHYHSAVQHGKSLANAIARLVYEVLPHNQREGIRPGSFGKMYGRFAGMDQGLSEPLESLRRLFTEQGDFLESVVHEYRDDVIEHIDPRSPIDLRAAVTSDDHLDIAKPTGGSGSDADPRYTVDPRWPGFMYRDFWHFEDKPVSGVDPTEQGGQPAGYEYHVHVHANFDVKEGEEFTKETPLGFVRDDGSGHFDVHGSHSHVFSSRDLPAFMASKPDVIFGMPGIADLLLRYASLTAGVLDQMEPGSALAARDD